MVIARQKHGEVRGLYTTHQQMPPRENPLAYISNLTCLLAFEIAMIGHVID